LEPSFIHLLPFSQRSQQPSLAPARFVLGLNSRRAALADHFGLALVVCQARAALGAFGGGQSLFIS
jgi:hypothetical protein